MKPLLLHDLCALRMFSLQSLCPTVYLDTPVNRPVKQLKLLVNEKLHEQAKIIRNNLNISKVAIDNRDNLNISGYDQKLHETFRRKNKSHQIWG
jgi:hypothetical protein